MDYTVGKCINCIKGHIHTVVFEHNELTPLTTSILERSQLVIGQRARELGHSCSALQTQGAMDRDRLQAALTSELALEGGGSGTELITLV